MFYSQYLEEEPNNTLLRGVCLGTKYTFDSDDFRECFQAKRKDVKSNIYG
jgi:hypothetical protein